jgi:regulator of sigma E protease
VSFEPLINIITNILYPALLVLLFFGLTIFVHEFGHFLVAKRRGMKIERFSIGFGPKIFGWTGKDGVDYRVSWIPFGGYVALPQMAPMEALEGKTQSKPEEISPAPPSSKIYVSFAGPIMNILFALLLAAILWRMGMPMPSNSTVIGWVEPNSPEELAGIQPGDRIVKIDGRPVKKWTDVNAAVITSFGPTVSILVERAGQEHEFLIEAEINPKFGVKTVGLYPPGRPLARRVIAGGPAEQAGVRNGDKFLSVDDVPVFSSEQLIGLIGKLADTPAVLRVMRDGEVVSLNVVPRFDPKYNSARIGVRLGDEVSRPGPTPVEQFREVFDMIGRTIYAFRHSKETGVSARSIGGPVWILSSWWFEFAYGGMRYGLRLAVVLNINLALINLLPIPVLDGGHILFATLEAIRRKPLSARLMHATSVAFASLLIAFMLYITVFDIAKLIPERIRPRGQFQTNEAAPATEPAKP